MTTRLSILFLCLFLSGAVEAGVSERVVYSHKLRHSTEGVDVIVTAKVNKFYSFADLGLIHSVIEFSKNKRNEPSFDGLIQFGEDGSMDIGCSDPFWNAKTQLNNNSLWIFDVTISEVFRGAISSNQVYIAMKPTLAYNGSFERPLDIATYICGSDIELDFGLIKIDEEEFMGSFQGIYCYMNNDLGFIKDNDYEGSSLYYYGHGKYNDIFEKAKESVFYVAREYGVPLKLDSSPDGDFVYAQCESEFRKSLIDNGIIPEAEK